MLYWIFDLDDTLYQIKKKDKHLPELYKNYSFLKKDSKLKLIIQTLNGTKVIMTNSIQTHCQMILNRLDLMDSFDYIFDRNLTKYIKPQPEVYLKLINKLNITSSDTVIFFDDSPVNLIMAKKFGWITILITPYPWQYQHSHPNINYIFPDIKSALAHLIAKSLQ